MVDHPLFLMYKVIVTSSNLTLYYIYVFGSNLTLSHVMLYIVNPSIHTVLNYSVAIPSQLIFFNTTTGQSASLTAFNISGQFIQAFDINGTLVAKNGVILYSSTPQEVRILVSANFPGIAEDPFPNLKSLSGFHFFSRNIGIYLLGLMIGFSTFLTIWRWSDDKGLSL